MAEPCRMSKRELFTHFAEHFGIKREEVGEFFYELQQLTAQELLRCWESVLPGGAKLVVQQREKRMGRNCTALRRDHPNGAERGHCAYRRRMDRDNEGRACEG